MAQKTFSISEAISFGWNTFTKNVVFWIICALLLGFVGPATFNFSKDFNRTDNRLVDSDNTGSLMKDDSIQRQDQDFDRLLDEAGFNSEMKALMNTQNKSVKEMSDEGPNSPAQWALIGILIFIGGTIGLIIGVVMSIVKGFLQLGYIKLELDAVRNKALDYKTLLSIVDIKRSFKLILGGFLYALLVLVGLILFVVPGIYWALKYMYFPYFMVDKNVGISESFKMSAQLTKGVKGKLFLMGLVGIGICMLGFMAFIVGVIPASIVLGLAGTFVYQKLLDQTPELTSIENK